MPQLGPALARLGQELLGAELCVDDHRLALLDRRALELVDHVLGGGQRVLDGLLARAECVELARQPLGLAAELGVLAHDVLEVRGDGVEEGGDLVAVEAAQPRAELVLADF